MTARILVVDDVAVNRKLLSARLSQAYYAVLVAESGEEALDILSQERIDLVILDVMMPGIGGYEPCRRIKENAASAEVPVVLLTSLDQPDDRLAGLAAGADDFLTKPVGDLSLLSRVRSLTRLKLASDDLRSKLGLLAESGFAERQARRDYGATGGVLLVEDPEERSELQQALRQAHEVTIATNAETAAEIAAQRKIELAIVTLTARDFDPLRLCSQLRSSPATRHLPILVAGPESEETAIWKALDLGANDYVSLPLDRCELLARVGTHIRRRRDDEALKESVRNSAEMAVRDPLTGLNNRRAMETHLSALIAAARRDSKPLSILIADIDHFKRINDAFGHSTGDAVLREFAARLRSSVRTDDVACRYGGEEFVVLMDGADEAAANIVAERLRQSVAASAFDVEGRSVDVTVSVGLARLERQDDGPSLIQRADRALYEAKNAGRNRVVSVIAA